MAAATNSKRYIILPARGLTADSEPEGASLLAALAPKVGAIASFAPGAKGPKVPRVRVVDSIRENGPKLIEVSPDDLPALRNAAPGVRIIPEVFYYPARVRPLTIESRVKPAIRRAAAPTASKVELTFVLNTTGAPVAGATVVAFTNFAEKAGAQGVTNAKGKVQLALGGAAKIERLYVYPLAACWPLVKKNFSVTAATTIKLEAIVFPYKDCVRYFYGLADLAVGQGVTVGVVDSGVGPHPDLVVAGGRNTVSGENESDFGANDAEGHGTHVGGIIAARGSQSAGMRGIAPGVALRSYRVFGKNADGASNFAIAKAIDAAVADGCDLINMSLGGGPEDTLTAEAISDARAGGTVVLAANGNDDRKPVSFPAANDLCLAVSAMGRKGSFPATSVSSESVAKPYGKDPQNFIASFSNIGEDTDLTGPGVGVISTVPSGYAVMDGTSMACPAATGALARQLAKQTDLLGRKRDRDRSNAIVDLMAASVASLGFGPLYEGKGLIKP